MADPAGESRYHGKLISGLRGEGLKSFFIVMDKLLLKDTAKMLCTFKTLEGFKQLNQGSGAELFMVLGCHLNTDL